MVTVVPGSQELSVHDPARAAAPGPMSPFPLVWYGPLHDASGYSDEARTFLLALEREGHAVAARSLQAPRLDACVAGAHLAAIERAAARQPPSGDYVSVFHFPPFAAPASERGPRVIRTMYETDRIPASWQPLLIDMAEIWVPSAFNVETFMRSGIPGSLLHVLPGTIDFDLFAPETVEPWPFPDEERFRFLTNFDFTDRKGWTILLDAWAQAFTPDDGVQLVLKCVSFHEGIGDIQGRIDAHLGGRTTAPIVLNTDVLAAADMPRLYAAADAYVLPSRGEGWGRPYMEAMAMGLPTIASRWSGNLGFMHDGNSWLVDGKTEPVRSWHELPQAMWEGHKWFEPDVDALVVALRRLYAGGEAVRERAAGARAELIEKFGPGATTARIAELTAGALERHAARRSRPPTCTWRGDFGSCHSLAVVNDGHVDALERAGLAVELRSPTSLPSPLDTVGVAGQWPPLFEAPSAGPFVLYQPWEFGRVPQRWVDAIRDTVDEVWAPSESVRAAYVDSGVAPDLVHVVPNGVDLDRFSPEGPVRALPTGRSTVFLFVGGTTHRKGIDVLLNAYRAAFTADDDVCLVIKGFGSDGVYRGQTAEALIATLQADPRAPELLFLDEDVPFAELPSLYRAADVLVQPYRAEGFCLPALEALACGVPLIVTAGGPTDDFASDTCAWRIPAVRAPLGKDVFATDGLALAGTGFTLEPDADSLVRALREAAEPLARAARAGAARAHAERFGWDLAAERARARLAALGGATPIRDVAAAAVPGRRGFLFLVPAEWDRRETWAPALRAYVEAFSDADDVTLVLPGTDDGVALALLDAELESLLADPACAPDIALADQGLLGLRSLELAADAVISAGRHASRARLVLPPDPATLRAAAPIAQEAA